MKKIVFVLIGISFMCTIAFAGEYVQTPEYMITGSPTSNQAEKINVDIQWGTPNRVVITWRIWSQDLSFMIAENSFTVIDIPDNPATDPTLCTDVDVPYGCCTGAYPGDPNNDCDEESTAFTDFVQGFATTLNTRAEALMWQDAQKRYATQPTP